MLLTAKLFKGGSLLCYNFPPFFLFIMVQKNESYNVSGLLESQGYM